MAVYIWPPVSVTTLPPLGGATSANQVLEIAELQDINANTAGPIKIRRNGTVQEVNKDTGIPANTVPVPVEIVAASGTEINITAGDINIQTTSEGGSFDSVRIGSGVGLYAEITANSELSVHDEDVVNAIELLAKLTDTQPVSIAGTVAVSGPLTDVQLRTNPVPVSLAAVPLPAGAATEATLDLIREKTDNLDVALSTRNLEATQLLIKAKTDNLDVALSTVAKDVTLLASNVLIGAVTETAPASDTASSGLNGRLQRIAQNISALILQFPATLGIKTAANSLSVAPASDAIFNTKPKATTGLYAENLALTTVATFTAPANAIGAIVQADDANAASFRAKQGATATASSGIQFQVGRSEEFKSGSDISVCSEGVSVKVYVQWFIQA